MPATERALALITRGIDRVEALKVRHARLIRLVQIASFVVLAAHYARFIRLPTLVVVPLWLSGIWASLQHGLWTGVLRPKLERARRR